MRSWRDFTEDHILALDEELDTEDTIATKGICNGLCNIFSLSCFSFSLCSLESFFICLILWVNAHRILTPIAAVYSSDYLQFIRDRT